MNNSFDNFLALLMVEWLNSKFIFGFSLCFLTLDAKLSIEISSLHLSFFSLSCPFATILVILDVIVHVFDFLWIFVCIHCSALWLKAFLPQTIVLSCSSFSLFAFDLLFLFPPYLPYISSFSLRKPVFLFL